MTSSSGSSIEVTPSGSSTTFGSGSAKFNLELHPDKTRLIEFGRYAAERRAARGLGKPETFDFLGFTHICGKGKGGQFWLKRITISKRMRAKLKQVNDQLKRRRHLPIPEQGKWLASVVRGHLAYYAVPGNSRAISAFRTQAGRHWLHGASASQPAPPRRPGSGWTASSLDGYRPARIVHPYPEVRFDVRTRGRSPVR